LWENDQTDHPGFVTASGQGGGDVLANPLFAGAWTAPPAANLQLTMASPAVAAGLSLSAVVHDFLGAPRPATGVDLGAFQYGAAVDAGLTTEGGTVASTAVDGSAEASGSGGLEAGGDSGIEATTDGAVPLDAPGEASKANASSGGCSCWCAGRGEGERVPSDVRWFAVAFGLAALLRRQRS
jgi:hypothetical protein